MSQILAHSNYIFPSHTLLSTQTGESECDESVCQPLSLHTFPFCCATHSCYSVTSERKTETHSQMLPTSTVSQDGLMLSSVGLSKHCLSAYLTRIVATGDSRETVDEQRLNFWTVLLLFLICIHRILILCYHLAALHFHRIHPFQRALRETDRLWRCTSRLSTYS